jgi:hypothetical protein
MAIDEGPDLLAESQQLLLGRRIGLVLPELEDANHPGADDMRQVKVRLIISECSLAAVEDAHVTGLSG